MDSVMHRLELAFRASFRTPFVTIVRDPQFLQRAELPRLHQFADGEAQPNPEARQPLKHSPTVAVHHHAQLDAMVAEDRRGRSPRADLTRMRATSAQ
jgi:hypothetical protein